MFESNNTKTLVFVIVGILLLGIISFSIYYFLRPSSQPTTQETTTTSNGLPTIENKGVPAPTTNTLIPPETKQTTNLKQGEEILLDNALPLAKITDFSTLSPSLTKEGDKLFFYKKDGGDLFGSDFSGKNQEKISNITVLGMTEAVWSPLKDRAAIFYLDQEIMKSFLHINTSSVAVLPQDITSFSWSPDGKSLAYTIIRDGLLNIITADSGGKNAKTIFTSPLIDAHIQWITSDKIALETAPSGLAEGFLFTFSRSTSVFKKIIGPVFGLSTLWSPDGGKALLSTLNKDANTYTLNIIDSLGHTLATIPLATVPQKCVWSTASHIFCAIPHNLPSQTILPDDYLKGKLVQDDYILSINIGADAINVFDQPGFSISHIVVNKKEDHLFFTNDRDGTLWSLTLK